MPFYFIFISTHRVPYYAKITIEKTIVTLQEAYPSMVNQKIGVARVPSPSYGGCCAIMCITGRKKSTK